MDELSHRKRSRDDSSELVSESESRMAKKIRDQLLSQLDDSDTVPVSLSHDLDSLIRSFEDEISGSKSSYPVPDPVTIFDLETGFGGIMPELDELTRVGTELQGISELWEFGDDLLSYDPFRFGSDNVANVTGEVDHTGNGIEYVSLDGLFDYSDDDSGRIFHAVMKPWPAL